MASPAQSDGQFVGSVSISDGQTIWSFDLATSGVPNAANLASGTFTVHLSTSGTASDTDLSTHALTIDTTAPTVSSEAITSATGIQNSTLNAGDVVSVTVTMSEAVTVTGTPQLQLNIGGTLVQANYASGSGTSALVFTYTVLAGQTDANGISINANALSLNGGTITDPAGNAATLTAALVADNASFKVDTTAPTVSTEAITSATGIQNSTLNAGDVVSVTVTMSEAVTVTGTPQLQLNIGGTMVQANYASGSGTSALVFTYTILAGQTDANGISLNANALSLNGGTITDPAGNAATLTAASVADNASFKVDTTAPTVSSEAITSATGIQNSTLNAGDVVSVTVTMSEAVTVTGTPQLELNIGGTMVQANYASGSGTSALVFTYTILAGQTDANGISINANALSLNGGTITDAAGNAATLTAALVADNASFKVDTTAPTVSTEAITSATGIQNSTLNAGDVVSVTVTMSEAVTVTGTPQLQLNIGGTMVQANYASGSGTSALVFTYTILAGQTDANGISLNANALSLNGGTITDAAGNAATLTAALVADNASFKVDTTAPAAPSGLDLAAADDSGSSSTDNITNHTSLLTITGSGEDGATVTVFDDIDNDGVVDGGESLGTGTVASGSFTVDVSLAAGTHNIRAIQTDVAGNASPASTTHTLDVTVDTTAAAPTGLDLAAADDSATNTDNITFNQTGLTITGSGEAGATVTLYDDVNSNDIIDGGETLATTTVFGGGSFGVDVSLFAQGLHRVKAIQTDVAGNTSGNSAALNITVDTVAPTISSIAVASGGADNSYKAGDIVTATVTFSEAVVVAGDLQLALNVGGLIKTASFAGGSGTSALTFNYTI